MNFKEFRILAFYEKIARRGHEAPVTQRKIAQETGMSLGTANSTIAQLTSKELIAGGSITKAGLEALEPYRAKRAVFIAAGFGSRLAPVTLETPKPLVRVNGRRIIESLLDAVTEAGIEEIYIVRGYLSEQFDQLLERYPNISFIENPLYNQSNTISSVFMAKEHLRNAYILESDLLLSNPDLIERYHYHSNYLAIPMETSEDWCFDTDKDVITSIQIGGTNCYQEVGISYWTDEDGARLAKDVEEHFSAPGGKEHFWDEIPLRYYKDNYAVHVRPCTFDDVVEIDTYQELKRIDSSYV